MEEDSLKRIEILNYLLGAIMVGASFWITPIDFTLGIMVGVAITCLNFTFLRKLVSRLLRTDPDKRGAVALLILPKMLGLLVAVGCALYFLKISIIGVGLGFSVFILSITIEAFRFWQSDNKPNGPL